MTIEERAEIYADNRSSEWLTDTTRQVMWDRYYNDYISIATEQRKIDIDKACEWLLSQNLISRCIVDDAAFVKRFRKALED